MTDLGCNGRKVGDMLILTKRKKKATDDALAHFLLL